MASSTPPMEIITDILRRLPVKDLLRYKSVAKSWYALISSPHFVKLHLPLQPPSSLLLIGPTSLQFLHSSTLSPTPNPPLPFPYPLSPPASLVGTLHGLVCVFSRKTLRYAVINPFTRQSRVIAAPPVLDPRASVCLGFGYDDASDEYWIVQVSSCSVNQNEFGRTVVVFGMRRREWRVVSDEICDEDIGGHGGVANGRMHWVSVKPGRDGKGRIVSYDVAGERFGEVMIPPYYGGQFHQPREVADMEGKLCFLTEANRGGMFVYIDVWIMRDYGDENSWNKMYSVWCLSLPYPVLSEERYGNRGRVLYCEDGNLCWFNRYEQKKDRPDVRGVEPFSEAVAAVGSLVPV